MAKLRGIHDMRYTVVVGVLVGLLTGQVAQAWWISTLELCGCPPAAEADE